VNILLTDQMADLPAGRPFRSRTVEERVTVTSVTLLLLALLAMLSVRWTRNRLAVRKNRGGCRNASGHQSKQEDSIP